MSDLKDLIRQRGHIKGRLTSFEKYLQPLIEDKLINTVTLHELRLRSGKLRDLMCTFEEIQSQIEMLNEDTPKQLAERDSIENSFFHLLAEAQSLIECSENLNKVESSSNISNKGAHLKLPPIKIPIFNGDANKWLSFRDMYLSLIHENSTIADINKFHYLKTYLEGSASAVINSVTVSSDNYTIAWQLLCERFDNKRLLINEHIKCLFSIEPLIKESHDGIRNLIDTLSKNLNALKSLGEPTDKWDTLIIYMASAKLDTVTSRNWEEHRSTKESPTLDDFYTFLRKRSTILETMNVSKINKYEKRHSLPNLKSFVSSSVDSTTTSQCPVCKQNHKLYECSTFKAMPVSDRIAKIVLLKLCNNCLRKGHQSYQCKLGGCRVCHKKHNTLIHKQGSVQNTTSNIQSPIDANKTVNLPSPAINSAPSCSTSTSISMTAKSTNKALLSTALVKVKSNENMFILRALLDCGSQSSFITDMAQKKIGVEKYNHEYHCVSGIGSTVLNVTEHCYLDLSSLNFSYSARVKCFVLPYITDKLPHVAVNMQTLDIPNYVQLADPKFYEPSDIDLLLGADTFWDLLGPGKINLGLQMPILQETHLGWIVAGPTLVHSGRDSARLRCHFSRDLSQQLCRFWELEEVPSNVELNSNDYCENLFTNTTHRDSEGRFCVQIPLKDHIQSLGDSYNMAENRLLQLEKRLKNNPVLKQKYSEFIHEYESLGHMTEVPRPGFGCFLPHHAVIRESSETTKLRVVFDASSKTTTGFSLNDIQYIGPVVQDDLFSILLRFRQHQFVVSADVEKMYRQILVVPKQRNLQMILWRDEPTYPIKTYELNTVTYGMASAPFLSTRCLVQLSKECEDNKLAQIIKEDFYVDDFLSGADNESDLQTLSDSVTSILNSACLPLRKWRTNLPSLFQNESGTAQPKTLDRQSQATVLGLNWDPSKDILQFSVHIELSQVVTKRSILSNSAKLFDPLGLLSPCTIVPKMILQRLWLSKLNWDDPVDDVILKQWKGFAFNLNSVSDFQLPRCALIPEAINIELHAFSDASQLAYASAVYLRSVNDSGQILVRLLCAKTKVAPVKTTTIPRLELCGALLSARLSAKVIKALRCKIDAIYCWTDSTIVLCWLSHQPHDLKPFVANRVSEIHDLTTNGTWRHVSGDKNPADLASRGVCPKAIQSANIWWNGPSFLTEDISNWPQNMIVHNLAHLPEMKVSRETQIITTLQIANISMQVIEFSRFSRFTRMLRTVGYVLRFIYNLRNKNSKLTGPFSTDELNASLNVLVKQHQVECFSNELKLLRNNQCLPPKSRILSLSPFINKNDVLCVGGRLQNSEESYEKKHPILLDSNHDFTKLLFTHHHLKLLHCGPQLLLNDLRNRFWPLRGRVLARTTVNNCKMCKILKAKCIHPIMGNLPTNRITPSHPFHISGVDFAGPFFITDRKGRGCKITKCYMCLFICFSTKAVHLEVASDMTTDCFILCLKRFIARRGKPLELYCDNGTNFVGANNELINFLRNSSDCFTDYATSEGIKFKFSPAYSPHFGGLWESGIKSAKHHVTRILCDRHFTFEELSTLFSQVEAILNSRPLTPLSSDPNDLDPLTPAHFLIGKPLTSLPADNLLEINPNRLNRYRLLEKMRQHFWDRWQHEYLCELQQRSKWRTQQREFQEGDLVVIKEANIPPLKWRMARIQKVYPGKDETVRVADLFTTKGVIRRAVHNLCPLESLSITPRRSHDFEGGEDV